jgi:hypothetical protein
MHDIVERFVGRYQIWRDAKHEDYRRHNPLNWFVFAAFFFIGLDIYSLLTSHAITWSMLVSDAVLVTFIVLYFRRSTLAWFIIPLFGIVCLVESPFMFFIAPSRYPLRVRVLSF